MYQQSISFLRITATIAVVWLHTCSTLVQNQDIFDMNPNQFKFFSAGYQMMYWAVPIFFMITGSLILCRNASVIYIRKHIVRILLALLIFGLPFAALRIVFETGNMNINIIPLSFMAMLENKSLSHLWYLYYLIGIYLIFPLLSFFVDSADNCSVKMVMGALFVIDFVVPTFNNLMSTKIAFSIPIGYPVFYVLMGYYLNKCDMEKYRTLSWILIGTIVSLIWFLNYFTSFGAKLTAYDSPLIAILAICIYIVFQSKTYEGVSVEASGRIWLIDRLCYGVYLIHPLFIQITYRVFKITPLMNKIYQISVVGFACLFVFVSFGFSWVLSRIGLLKKYVL